jgi:hypothetical protein
MCIFKTIKFNGSQKSPKHIIHSYLGLFVFLSSLTQTLDCTTYSGQMVLNNEEQNLRKMPLLRHCHGIHLEK